MPIEPILEYLTSMRNQMNYYVMRGQYKEYVQLRKKFATQFIKFPEEVQYLKMQHTHLSIFSREGFNVLKTWFREFFRKKTPDELKMEELARDIMVKRKAGIIA